jgi:hypothetical protein
MQFQMAEGSDVIGVSHDTDLDGGASNKRTGGLLSSISFFKFF